MDRCCRRFAIRSAILALALVAAFAAGWVARDLRPDQLGSWLPLERAEEQRVFSSEQFREALEEWERIWFLDQDDEQTPQRVHGGII